MLEQVNQVEYGLAARSGPRLDGRAPHGRGGRGRVMSGSTSLKAFLGAPFGGLTKHIRIGARKCIEENLAVHAEKNIT